MQIYGLQKTSLLDYPEHISAIVFTGGCNFNCPFCHNSELLHPRDMQPLQIEEIFSFLKKRAGVLEGVVITGGEPTIHPDLPDFIRRIRNLNLKVKLDTNGTFPDRIQYLIENRLLDYIAMDVKAAPDHYAKAAGVKFSVDTIKQSITWIQNSHIPYEFRTTVVRELHEPASFHELGQLLSGAKLCCLQTFRDSANVSQKGLHPFTEEEMKQAAKILSFYVQKVQIR
ncbi:MAG: anaerobic ribonucleoside-triphosphate reductase activating protein [Lachnospiraceae bacterium]|nr:anaerobic ribonucleoside-triphosphate reductase activating protein [Lachnospiraceae bacterium]